MDIAIQGRTRLDHVAATARGRDLAVFRMYAGTSIAFACVRPVRRGRAVYSPRRGNTTRPGRLTGSAGWRRTPRRGDPIAPGRARGRPPDPCGHPCRAANARVREDGTPQGRPLRRCVASVVVRMGPFNPLRSPIRRTPPPCVRWGPFPCSTGAVSWRPSGVHPASRWHRRNARQPTVSKDARWVPTNLAKRQVSGGASRIPHQCGGRAVLIPPQPSAEQVPHDRRVLAAPRPSVSAQRRASA